MRYAGLIVAVIVAAIAAVAVMQLSKPEPAPAAPAQVVQEIKSVNIYVASKAIPIGSVLDKDMLSMQPWPEHLLLEGFIVNKEGAQPIEGMVTRAPFQQGEPIILSKLSNPNDPNFLAGELPSGMRVVSIPLNEVDGVAGFIFPGDHVDVIYTHEVDSYEFPPPQTVNTSFSGSDFGRSETTIKAEKVKRQVTETILTNVKVMGVDQRTTNVGATDKDGKLVVPRSASLMVSQADAQRVRLAQKSGTLSLALRSLADKEVSDPLLFTNRKDISINPNDTSDSGYGSGSTIKILRGANKQPSELVGTSSPSITRSAPKTNATATVSSGAPSTSNPVTVAAP